MLRKSKVLSVILILTMAVTLFTGCASKNNSENAEGGNTASGNTTEGNKVTVGVPAESVNIVWYRCDYSDASANQQVEDAINAYIEPKIGVTVTMNSISGGDYSSKLTLDLAADENVDLFWSANWLGSDDLLRSNAVYDISDMIQNYSGLYNSMPEKVWDSSEFSGKNYFVPIYKETGTGFSYITSKELAGELGWDLTNVKKFADLEPFLESAKKAGVKYPLALEGGDLFETVSIDDVDFVASNKYAGVQVNGDTAKIVNTIETDEFKDFVNLMYRWNQAGYIHEDLVQGVLDSSKILAAIADKSAGFTSFTTIPDAQNEASRRTGADVELVNVTDNWINSGSALGSMYGIASTSTKADACLKFLDLLYTDQTLADLCTYGIEGTNYTRDTNGKVTLISDTGFNYGLWQSTNVNAASLLSSESDNKKDLYEDFNSSAKPSPLLGFRFDNTGYEAEIAAVQGAYDTYYLLLTRGFVEPESGIEEFVSALKSAGVDKLIEAVQSQYDEFLAAK